MPTPLPSAHPYRGLHSRAQPSAGSDPAALQPPCGGCRRAPSTPRRRLWAPQPGATKWLRTAVLAAALGLAVGACSHAPPSRPAPQPTRPAAAPVRTVYLGSLDLTQIQQGWGHARADSSLDGHPLTVAGHVFAHGVGTHAYSITRIALDGRARRFLADVGVDDEVKSATGEPRGSVVFQVWVDSAKVFDSGVMHSGQSAKPVAVSLSGAHRLWLVVDAAGNGIRYDHADWADARFELAADAGVPRTFIPRASVSLTPPPPATPRVVGPEVLGARPGHPIYYRIPVTGQRPMTFSVDGLPAGLSVDDSTGIITGAVRARGHYHLTLRARNALGAGARGFTLDVGDTIALTPPMGWNDWNVWGCSISAAKVRAAADELVSSGLANHGWRYINIDDCWMRPAGPGARAADGTILPNSRFPDMKALADYVHSRGLLLGIYTGPNAHTCQRKEAAGGHERQDMETFARWGIDYVKYDWCDRSRDSVEVKYARMGKIIQSMPRDIVYSLCEYGWDNVWTWGASVGGNLWRTTGDINDSWGSLYEIGFHQDRMAPYAGPGHWNDPDMLVVGHLGWGPHPRPTRLTPDEQYTHISLWSLLSAPLLIGADLSKLDAFTLGLLTNDEVLAIDQDPRGEEARQVAHDGPGVVYLKHLADGSVAVGLFNTDLVDHTLHVSWEELGLHGPQRVRDVWRQAWLGTLTTGLSDRVDGHGVLLLRLVPAAP